MPRNEPTPAELREQLGRLYGELKDLHDLRVLPGVREYTRREVVLCRAIQWAEVELAQRTRSEAEG